MSEEDKLREYLRRAVADAHRFRRQLTETEEKAREPIAIVGLGCRFPGGVTSPDDLWRMVRDGVDGLTPFPADRGWEVADVYGEDAGARAALGGFLDAPGDFDAGFFGISPREAQATDPQQRLLLEVSWEALERAGIDPHTLRGSRTGVFFGGTSQEFGGLLAASEHAQDGHLLTGTSASVLSGRVAYVLGLEGPALTVDTACSSSLVTLHLAAESLRRGEANLALVGGVTVMATPAAFGEFSRQGGLAGDGRCKAFAEAADGTGWGEGVGVVVAERLSDAQRLGHPVLAVLRGSGINSDGASNGLTAPNGQSQRRLIEQVLAACELTGADVDLLEGHGTGTTLGDPIEARALLATYGRDRAEPVWLGSVKSNVGHTQYAAGIAGVLKVVLALRHAVLPKTLHVDEPSRHVDWTAGTLRLLTETIPWPDAGRPRRAAVSSFGVSGTNAHAVFEQAPEAEIPAATPQDGPLPFVLSARTAPALRAQAEQLRAWLSEQDTPPVDLAHSLLRQRSRFEERAVVVASGAEELARRLQRLADGAPDPSVVTGRRREGRAVFVFPGQGSQWAGMGRALAAESSAFAEALDECAQALAPLVDWSLTDVLARDADDPLLARVDVVQPALWAVMVSLAAWWRSCGVRPAAVVGHSQGEVAAMCAAGGLSLTDGALIVVTRAKLVRAKLSGAGAMISVAADADTVAKLLEPWAGRLGIAGRNSPSSTVVSGDADAADELLAHCAGTDVRARRIAVDYASHSPHVEVLEAELRDLLAGIKPVTSAVPFLSTVTGELMDTARADAGYWYRNLREPVRFADAVRTLLAEDHRTFVETSPHPVLTSAVHETADDADTEVCAVGTLRRGEGDLRRALLSLAEAHVTGTPAEFPVPAGRRADLPTYPFQHQRFWLDARPGTGDVRTAGLDPADHPLLGASLELAEDGGLVATARLSVATHPWLADHAVAGRVLLPGAALLELSCWAGWQLGCDVVRELTLRAPVLLPESGAVRLQLAVGAADEHGERAITVSSRPDRAGEPWTSHATGVLAGDPASAPPLAPRSADAEPIDVTGLYERLRAGGLEYGPAFQGLRQAWRDGDDVLAEIVLAAPSDDGYAVHPALLDAALHGLALFDGPGGAAMPFEFTDVRIHSAGARALRVRLSRGANGLRAEDASGAPVFSIGGVTLRPATALPTSDSVFQPDWVLTGAVVPVPGDAVVAFAPEPGGDPVADAHHAAEWALHQVQAWLASPSGPQLVVVTRSATAVTAGEATDPAHATVTGLIRSAQAENPGGIVLVDTDDPAAPLVLAEGEPEVALRAGRAHVRRLHRFTGPALTVPDGGWRLDTTARGTLGNLAAVDAPEAARELAEGEVRIAVRAAGLNFRDVLIALDMYPGEANLGSEGAGVVVETGPGVTAFAPGDAVLGMFDGAFGPLAVADHRRVARIPRGWSFERAAAVPIVFLTAYYGLVDLAGLQAGEKVLVHAAAGGVGGAAVQLARHLGAEVFGTASPAKHAHLAEAGLDPAHVANSRTADFETAFAPGVDVVLNSLTGELLDASLRLLPGGGRFVEMGKADPREPGEVAAAHPGVVYQRFDLADASPERIAEMLATLVELFEAGVLAPPPVTVRDVGEAPEAFRVLSQAGVVGKIVLRIDPAFAEDETVLITGGTGTLATLLARHLVTESGLRHVTLLSRRGGPVPEELAGLADVSVVACDVADEPALTAAIDGITSRHRLAGVVHAAGVLDDGIVESLTAEKLHAVLKPKVDGAWPLHRRTEHLDLRLFVLFSSAAATFGNPGQGNYAAANAFLDGLAQHRHALGLPATSLAWGLWQERSAMTTAAAGPGLATDEALASFDRSWRASRPVLVPARLDPRGPGGPLVADLVRAPRRRVAVVAESQADRLAALPAAERQEQLVALVRAQVAAVLGHDGADQVVSDRSFRELGFDSLTAVELRNRLAAATKLRLPATLAFDYPTPTVLAAFLAAELVPAEAVDRPADPDEEIRELLRTIPVARLRAAGLLDALVELGRSVTGQTAQPAAPAADISSMTAADLVRMAMTAREPQ
ncbi:type I polyketide synthase [Amycolatopsis sp. PS_44_ISF1]|uniref:type I polyketide synthase n=1 Tax=Amycolatopsis sp. PS_44_ISF1 TaxID=2974917 RepID=UPI0028DF3C8D|nr:type I polyketide synthase [Amycolatopsis sp. PS_44_ISF1]MDT8912323.1 type I polyketide synthase [Amycolatopsis sp. PS_44_ISF1]